LSTSDYSSGIFLQKLVKATQSLCNQTKNWDTADLLMRNRGGVYSCLIPGVRRNLRCSGNLFITLT